MNLIILTLGLIFGNGTVSCSECAAELLAMQNAQAIYDAAYDNAQDALDAYFTNPTQENYDAWVAAAAVLVVSETALTNAQQAYADCMLENGGGPIEDDLLRTTVSILE